MTTEIVHSAGAPPLELDPIQHMSVVLNRAKGWLDEARSIDDVRAAKAIAVGYESVLREKELAFDAQLAATELVRRCERRIGELVREGQREGTIRRQGDQSSTTVEKISVKEIFADTNHKEQTDTYVMADVPAEGFEQAISEAREEGNLSRANVVRKVKGEQPKATDRSEWHRKRSRIDSNRILMTLAQEIDAAAQGLELMDPADLDEDLVAECVPAIRQSIGTIKRHLRRITSE